MLHSEDGTPAQKSSSIGITRSNVLPKRLNTLESPVHIADQVLAYLKAHREEYVLRCIQVAP